MDINSKIHVLTCKDSAFRIPELEKQFREQGITNFELVFGENISENKHEKPHTIIANGHKAIVERNLDKPYITIVEDDILFTSPNSWRYYVDSFKYLPDDWDIYLGGVYKPSYVSDINIADRLSTCSDYSGLHFYTIHQRFYKDFLKTPKNAHIDKYMFELSAKSYLLNPVPSIQQGIFSVRKNRRVDYSSLNNQLNLLKK